MDDRKINKVGTNTLTVSLPTQWIKKNELKQGDKLNYKIQGKEIIFSSAQITAKSLKTEIFIHSEDFFSIRSILGGLYRAGFDEIIINFDSYEILLEIHKALEYIMGYEYFEISENKGLIKNVVKEINMDITDGILKIRHLINTVHIITKEDITNKEYSRIHEVLNLGYNALKYRDIVLRMIVSEGVTNRKVIPYYAIAFALGRVTGFYRVIYKTFEKNKLTVSKEALAYYDSVNKYFNHLISFKKSFFEIQKGKMIFEDEAIRLIKKNPSDTFLITMSLSICRIVQSINSSIIMLQKEESI